MGAIGLIVLGYLLGALPFSVALASAHGLDLTAEPDVIAALRRSAGWPSSLAVVIVDIAKGVFPVLLGLGFSLPPWGIALAGFAAVAGQMWPPLRGHGGKGNCTGLGSLVALLLVFQAFPGLFSLVFFAAGASVMAYGELTVSARSSGRSHPLAAALPVGLLLGFAAAPVLCGVTDQPASLTMGLLLILCAIVAKRLTSGLRADLSVGAHMGRVLWRRLVFDQSLAGWD